MIMPSGKTGIGNLIFVTIDYLLVKTYLNNGADSEPKFKELKPYIVTL